jgi:hypothetical protein
MPLVEALALYGAIEVDTNTLNDTYMRFKIKLGPLRIPTEKVQIPEKLDKKKQRRKIKRKLKALTV